MDIKLDMSRMTGTEEILKRYNPSGSGGIPWFAFVDPRGKILATSDGPRGNIGYPARPEEIAHFVKMLKQAASKLDATRIETIENALKAEAEKIEAAQAGTDR